MILTPSLVLVVCRAARRTRRPRTRGRAGTPRRAAAGPTARRAAPTRGRRSRRAHRTPPAWQRHPWLGSVPTEHDGFRSSCPAAGQRTSPSRGTTIPASRSKYSRGLIRLYGSGLVAGVAGPGRRPCGVGIGQVADELPDRVGGQREVGLEDPRVRAGLAVHAAGEAHHPRALRARRVGDVRLAVRAGAEVVDQPQVRALDRLDQLAGRLDHARRRQWPVELPVGVARRRCPSRRAGGRAARRGTPTVPAARRAGRRRPTGSGSR